jgi:hypothetical protein
MTEFRARDEDARPPQFLEDTAGFADALLTFHGQLEQGGLESSADQVARIVATVKAGSCTVGRLKVLYATLDERLHDELGRRILFQIDRRHEAFFDKPNLFGPEVSEQFPSATFDISEAGSCFATGRPTACVMHLNRVLETAFDAIQSALGMTLDTDKGWEPTLRVIRDRLKEKSAELGTLKLKQFFDDVVGHLYAIKNAWRNPSVHAGAKYTGEEAESIFNAVKGFMQALAKNVREGQATLF